MIGIILIMVGIHPIIIHRTIHGIIIIIHIITIIFIMVIIHIKTIIILIMAVEPVLLILRILINQVEEPQLRHKINQHMVKVEGVIRHHIIILV
jgi:hypothetical protein